MDIPILGTIDLTPTGIFLFFAAVIAVGYFGWQIFGTARPGRDAAKTDEAPLVEASKDEDEVKADPKADKNEPTDT